MWDTKKKVNKENGGGNKSNNDFFDMFGDNNKK